MQVLYSIQHYAFSAELVCVYLVFKLEGQAASSGSCVSFRILDLCVLPFPADVCSPAYVVRDFECMFPSRKKKDKLSNFKSNFSKYIMHSYFLSALSFLLTFALFISIYTQYICVLEKHSTLIYSSIDEAVDRAWGILITLLKNRYIMHYRCSCCWFGCMLVLN